MKKTKEEIWAESINKWNKSRIGKTFEEIYGKEKAEEIKNKMSKNRKGKTMKKSTRLKCINLWKQRNSDERSYLVQKMLLAKNMSMSENERKLNDIIQKNNLPFNFVGDGKIVINGFCPDFLSSNPKHIIELYGCRHNDKKSKKRDKLRLKSYSKLGYKTLVLYNWNLTNPSKVLNKILEFMNEK